MHACSECARRGCWPRLDSSSLLTCTTIRVCVCVTPFILQMEEVVKCLLQVGAAVVMPGPQAGATGLRLAPLRPTEGETLPGAAPC